LKRNRKRRGLLFTIYLEILSKKLVGKFR